MSLYLSIHTRNDALKESAIHHAVTALAAKSAEIMKAGTLPQETALAITYLLPEGEEALPFEGIRIERYDSKSGLLSFQVAVPPHIVDSHEAAYFAATALLDVIDHALLYFRDTYATHGVRFKPVLWHRALVPLFKAGSMNQGGMAHA